MVPDSSSAVVSDDGSQASEDSPVITKADAKKKRGLFRKN